MYRFHNITQLAPLISTMPFGAWLMLVASTLASLAMRPARVPLPESAKR